MTAAGIAFLQFLCALSVASVISYIGGRVHQRRREDDQRRDAFRQGYLRASASAGGAPFRTTEAGGS